MSKINANRIVVVALAIIATTFLDWLAGEFRAVGVFGTLQENLSFLFVLPYLTGVIIGGSTHAPNNLAFSLALFLQSYAIIAAAFFLTRKAKALLGAP